MAKWHLVRHARTAWNSEGRVQGHTDTPLDSTGRAQAERLAKKLASIPFAAAYASDLARATETARAVLQGRTTPLEATPELREIHYGQWEGLTYQEVEAGFHVEYADLLRASVDFTPPGGESVTHLIARTSKLRDQLVAAHPDDDLLVVGHSGSIRGLLLSLLGLPPDAFWRFRLVPASFSIVTLHNPGVTLESWGDTSHLEGLDGP